MIQQEVYLFQLVLYFFFKPQNIESAEGGNVEVNDSLFCGFLFDICQPLEDSIFKFL